MDLQEHCAKDLLNQYEVAIPKGKVATSVEQGVSILKELNLAEAVVKAQVLAGGRGKSGGIKKVTAETIEQTLRQMLGENLVTYQTTSEGLPVNSVLIEEISQIKQELYLALLVDRTSKSVVIMASTEGGVDIEAVAEKTPEKIFQVQVPIYGINGYLARQLAFKLGFSGVMVREFSSLVMKLHRLFVESDLGLLEINPLIITNDDQLVCLDAKVHVDDNAMFRQMSLAKMRDESQENAKEVAADKMGLSYIALDGYIGCMVNGAGLAMATMDMIKLCGGEPANFLDVGGNATEDRVTEAFKLIGQDPNVKVIFVNIFGGIVRCDLIADGIIKAVSATNIAKPVVVRLEGHNAKLGHDKLAGCDLNIQAVHDFKDAAQTAVSQSKVEK